MREPQGYARTTVQTVGLLLGAGALLAFVALPPPAAFAAPAWHCAGVTILMAAWWATGAIPLSATALVPLVAFPVLGIVAGEDVGAPYASSTIFLILGGFLIGLAMERWNLHKRIAFRIVARVGGEPRRLLFGMMVATAVVSMFVSNTSTALMMLPVALSIAAVLAPDGGGADARHFGTAIVLSVAYAATIGGLGTLIGTPTNALVAGFMQQHYGVSVSFAQWLAFGLPTVALLLPLAWFVLVRAFPFRLEGRDGTVLVRERLAQLGPATTPEKRVAFVFAATAALWIARPWLVEMPGLGGLTDAAIAIGAALALFLWPAGRGHEGACLHAEDLRRVPWDVLLLFGGGLALAEGIKASGLSDVVAGSLAALSVLPLAVLVIAIALLLVFWTELNSNVAAAATAMPVLAAISAATDYPVLLLLAPAAMAASCGFMLPVGTPPNAIVFATGRVTLPQMMRAGVWADLAAVAVVTVVALTVVPWVAR
ncbi:MAG: SLC13 family permease [Pseudomonadota bacterium]